MVVGDGTSWAGMSLKLSSAVVQLFEGKYEADAKEVAQRNTLGLSTAKEREEEAEVNKKQKLVKDQKKASEWDEEYPNPNHYQNYNYTNNSDLL
jgi:hypothetical protein